MDDGKKATRRREDQFSGAWGKSERGTERDSERERGTVRKRQIGRQKT